MNSKIWLILTSAILYGISIPISKLILKNGVSPSMLAAFTYLGAGMGLGIFNFFKKYALKQEIIAPLTKKELPYIIAMIAFDIAAIILLMYGISKTTGANASLLSNFEIVSTSVIAYLLFKEQISKKLGLAIILIITAGVIISYEKGASFDFSLYSLLVTGAYICWGAENNCTKMLSNKNTEQITIIKGIFAGIGSLIAAFIAKEQLPSVFWLAAIMFAGFFSYGLSVTMYIKSQRYIGAAKTASYFSLAPFLGVIFSIFLLGEIPDYKFYIALILMIIAAILTYFED